MIFKPGDKVTVIPSQEAMFTKGLGHPKNEVFTVVSVSETKYPCCAGHSQRLRMDNGEVYSGAWFDMDLDNLPVVMCDRHRTIPGDEI